MELPEAKLIRSELLLRDMQLTDDVKMTKKSLVRWLALSLGLITPKESRQSVLSLMEALLFYHLKENKEPTYADLQDYLKEQNVEVNEKTLRYHLTNLRKAGVLEDARGVYRFTGFNGNNLSAALEESYKRRADLAFSNIKSAVDLLQKMHSE